MKREVEELKTMINDLKDQVTRMDREHEERMDRHREDINVELGRVALTRGISTISRHDHRDHASSHVDSHEPYPALCTLVERSEGASRDADELDEWFHSDALFGFAITTHSDRVVWMGRIERDMVLNRILSMGIYDWKDTDKQGGGSCPVMSIRYAAVLGNWLL